MAWAVLALVAAGCASTRAEERAALEREREARIVFEDLLSRGAEPDEVDPQDPATLDSFDRAARSFAEAAAETAEEAIPPPPPENPYLEFGPNIVWYPLKEGQTERLIMKPFHFPPSVGKKIFDLLKTYGDFPIYAAVEDGALPPELGVQPSDAVLLDLRPGFSAEAYSDPRAPGLASPEAKALSDVLFVTATAQRHRDIELFVELFAANVRQIEVEAKIVEVTTREALDLGVRPVDGDTPIFGGSNPGTFVGDVDFSFGNSADVTEALFELGAVFDGVTFNAILEAVEDFENVSIISRPKVAVREGGRAEIVNVTRIPYYNVSAITAAGVPTLALEFQDAGVQMYVIPQIVGRDTMVLNIEIEASTQTGSSESFNVGNSIVTVPQISQRTARTVVRLQPGQAVIMGGLTSERTVDRESKVPLLGDIPLVGTLFKSKLTSKEQTNVLFFIRPRILEGSDLNTPFD
ncbi:MAG: hypothetical protein AAFU73_12840 [Planctomycetota bacterium]